MDAINSRPTSGIQEWRPARHVRRAAARWTRALMAERWKPKTRVCRNCGTSAANGLSSAAAGASSVAARCSDPAGHGGERAGDSGRHGVLGDEDGARGGKWCPTVPARTWTWR